MYMLLDKAFVDVRSLPDDDLIALLCATEEEIEAHGEFNELKELLHDCAMELLRRPEAIATACAVTLRRDFNEGSPN